MSMYADGDSTLRTGVSSTVSGGRCLRALVGGASLVAALVLLILWEPALIPTVVLLAIALAFFIGGVALYRGTQSALVRVIAVIVFMVGSFTAILAFLMLALVATNFESEVIEGPATTWQRE